MCYLVLFSNSITKLIHYCDGIETGDYRSVLVTLRKHLKFLKLLSDLEDPYFQASFLLPMLTSIPVKTLCPRKCQFAQYEYLGVWFHVSSVPDCEYISVKEPTFCSTRVHILQVSKQERSFILPSLCFGSYSGMLICLARLGSRSSGSLTTVLGSTPHIVVYRQALGDSHGQFSIQV